MNNQQQDFEKLFRNELEMVKFQIPEEEKTNLLPIWSKIMNVSSLEKLQCDYDTHRSIMNALSGKEVNFNLWEISFLLNTFTRISPKELEIPAFIYTQICFYNHNLSKLWNDLVMPIREGLVKKLKTQAILNAPKNNMKVIPNKRR